jgi:hypothetical protein
LNNFSGTEDRPWLEGPIKVINQPLSAMVSIALNHYQLIVAFVSSELADLGRA